jgi:hypothetical protein
MGKYMRKAEEVAVMEVPGGGVRTRSRTLALQQCAPPEKGETPEYLELRSRRLEKPPHPKEAAAAAARRSVAGKKGAPTALNEDAVEVSFGENLLDFDAIAR